MRPTIIIALLLASVSFAGNEIKAQNISEKNLILFYQFDGNARDLSGNKHDLKVNDDPKKMLFAWTAGRDGKPNTALEFKGQASGLMTGLNISPAAQPELTMTAWVYGHPTGFLFGTTIPQKEVSSTINRCMYFGKDYVSSGYMYYNKINKKVYPSYLQSSETPEDKWHFVAISINAKDSTLRLYADGEYYAVAWKTVLKKVFFPNKVANLIIGSSYSPASPQQFTGKVDEIRVYNKALSAEELSSISGITFKDAGERIARNERIKSILMLSLVIFFAFSIIYMVVMFFREKKYKPVSDQEFAGFVSDSQSASDISATNELAQKYLDDTFAAWTPRQQNTEDEFRSPTKKKHFIDTFAALEKARELKPSEKHIVDRMNELGEIYNHLTKRRFYGNKVLIVAALILPIIFLLIEWGDLTATKLNGFFVFILPTVSYVLASFAPTYVVANRDGKVNKLFGGIFAVILGAGSTVLATEYYNEIKWSDGSKTIESDTGSNMLTMVLGFIIIIAALLLSMFLVGLSAIISFFRNYVFFK